MSSRGSSSSHVTIVPSPQQDGGAFPNTPPKSEKSKNQSPTSSGNSKTTPSTLQQRRGRRKVTDDTFRPLSVFTKSLLIPFDQNFEKAFDALETDSPDRVKIARSILCPEAEDEAITERDQEPLSNELVSQVEPRATISPETQEGFAYQRNQSQVQVADQGIATPYRPISNAIMIRQKSTRDIDMDLITALKLTSPEKDSIARVTGDFATLCELPVPDPSEHPAFASQPFQVKTQAPLVFSTTNAEDIRAYKSRGYKSCDDQPDNNGKSVERKISLFGLGLNISTPSSAKSRNAFNPSNDLPFPPFPPSSYVGSTRSSTKDISPTTIDFPATRECVSIDTSGRARNLSGFFKRRDTHERNDHGSPAWSPRTSVENSNLTRQDLEKFLRRITFTPTYDFDPASSYPRHPTTGRGWKSRNLKCTTCSTTDCAVCHRVCCAYRAAVLALDHHDANSPARPLALQRIQEITKLYPYGKEAPTFLQCTAETGGGKMGCGKTVCPDCCGVCPDGSCSDTVCRKCKPKVWEDCDWHKSGRNSIERLHY